MALPAGDVLKSALAGGLASALSTSLMHPIDTIKVSHLLSFAAEYSIFWTSLGENWLPQISGFIRTYLISASTVFAYCGCSMQIIHCHFHYQTRVQASTLSFPEVIAKLPEIGVRGVYRGSIPAILGQFSRSYSCFKSKISLLGTH